MKGGRIAMPDALSCETAAACLNAACVRLEASASEVLGASQAGLVRKRPSPQLRCAGVAWPWGGEEGGSEGADSAAEVRLP